MSPVSNLLVPKCNWSETALDNNKIDKQYDITMRSVLPMAFQEIRKGYTALKSFCYIMNMPPPNEKK